MTSYPVERDEGFSTPDVVQAKLASCNQQQSFVRFEHLVQEDVDEPRSLGSSETHPHLSWGVP